MAKEILKGDTSPIVDRASDLPGGHRVEMIPVDRDGNVLTGAGGGGGGANVQGVIPQASSSVFLGASCAGSATAFGSQACTALLVNNATGVAIDLQFGGAGTAFRLNDGQMVLIPGISNASAVSAKRSDGGATSVTVSAMAVTK